MATITWPLPSMPGAGTVGVSSSIPSNSATSVNGNGYLDQLTQELEQFNSSQNPNVLQGLVAYIMNLTSGQDSSINTTDVNNLLDQAFATDGGNGQTSNDINLLIQTAAAQGAESAFFFGYNGVNGEQGVTNYVSAVQSALGTSPTSSYAQTFLSYLTTNFTGTALTNFTTAHTNSSNQYIWTYTDNSMTVTYTYNASNAAATDPTNSDGSVNDNFYIWQLIQGLSPADNTSSSSTSTSTANSLFSVLASNYNAMTEQERVLALNALLSTGMDPINAIFLLLDSQYEPNYLSQEEGYSNTATTQTLQTNTYATPLLNEINTIASDAQGGTAVNQTDAQNLVNDIENWNTYASLNYNSSSIVQSLDSNTITPLLSTPIPDPNSTTGGTITLGTFIQNIANGTSSYTYSSLASSLGNIIPNVSNPIVQSSSGALFSTLTFTNEHLNPDSFGSSTSGLTLNQYMNQYGLSMDQMLGEAPFPNSATEENVFSNSYTTIVSTGGLTLAGGIGAGWPISSIEIVVNGQQTTVGGWLTEMAQGTTGLSNQEGEEALQNATLVLQSTAPSSATSTAFSGLSSDAQAGADLVVQTSKQTTTAQQTIADLLNTLYQLLTSAVSPAATGGTGGVALASSIINNDIVA